jgi:predicted CXXCH cytochrome family protein
MIVACDREVLDAPHEEVQSEAAAAAAAAEDAEYVTSASCQGCHQKQFEAWTGSHHDRAMQPATKETVLGDFADAGFVKDGEAWKFSRQEGTYIANTLGPDGARADFEILYTFGVDPLQQYLVALPGGRLYALTVAWDTRPAAEGGQRWFSLYPDEVNPPGDLLHWSGIANNWNAMCASCHSTNLQKNYDPVSAAYDTSWSEINVACEACHGPASLHLAWAEAGGDESTGRGFANRFGAESDRRWQMNPDTGISALVSAPTTDNEIEACSGCHARRSLISEAAAADGARFLDRHMPALLEEGLYFADGQIRDEVYVYGSFLQSKMHGAGVRCGDCHEPHSLALRQPGDALCAQCHAPSVFAVRSHHQHPEESSGARCVECHMPERTYMVIDDRRDHGIRIPRPDLSVEIGSPNACNGCHADRDAKWAANAIAGWPGHAKATPAHYGSALHAGRTGAAGAQQKLLDLAGDFQSPGIVRASAVSLLSRYANESILDVIRNAAADADPLLRMAAVRASDSVPITIRTPLIGRLLLDPIRAVRIEAARALAGADPDVLGGHLAQALGPALEEYRLAQRADFDRPNAHVNLALLDSSMGRSAEAEAHYQNALDVGPYFIPTYVNYADLLRRNDRDGEGAPLLRQGLAIVPDSADLHHVLGLLLVRLGSPEEALGALARANQLAPENARYAYVLGIALYSQGQVEQSLEVLRAADERHPADVELLEALISICREAGLVEESRLYSQRRQAL